MLVLFVGVEWERGRDDVEWVRFWVFGETRRGGGRGGLGVMVLVRSEGWVGGGGGRWGREEKGKTDSGGGRGE